MKEKPGCVFLLYAGTRAVMSINKAVPVTAEPSN